MGNHNVNRTLDMQMYVLSKDELNKVGVRGRMDKCQWSPRG